MIYAATAAGVEKARVAFSRKWKLRCKELTWSSLRRRGGESLFTFLRAIPWRSGNAPPTRWSASTEIPRRRTKTQASLPSEDAVLLLLFGLIRSGQITLRRMVGWQEMPAVTQRSNAA
ncbi:hypothetical protein KF840_17475 [bacterium]|nr:hypothetical protein [bacterium]